MPVPPGLLSSLTLTSSLLSLIKQLKLLVMLGRSAIMDAMQLVSSRAVPLHLRPVNDVCIYILWHGISRVSKTVKTITPLGCRTSCRVFCSGWKPVNDGKPIDRRKARGNWCNVKGAGLGERPRASPMPQLPMLDAYVWIKPPGAMILAHHLPSFEPSSRFQTYFGKECHVYIVRTSEMVHACVCVVNHANVLPVLMCPVWWHTFSYFTR